MPKGSTGARGRIGGGGGGGTVTQARVPRTAVALGRVGGGQIALRKTLDIANQSRAVVRFVQRRSTATVTRSQVQALQRAMKQNSSNAKKAASAIKRTTLEGGERARVGRAENFVGRVNRASSGFRGRTITNVNFRTSFGQLKTGLGRSTPKAFE